MGAHSNLLNASETAFAALLSFVVGVLSILSSTCSRLNDRTRDFLKFVLKTAVHNNLFAQGTGFMEDSSVDGGGARGIVEG